MSGMFPSEVVAMVNQGLLAQQGSTRASSHMGFCCPQEPSSLSNLGFIPYGFQQPSRTLSNPSSVGVVDAAAAAAADQLREKDSAMMASHPGDGALHGGSGVFAVHRSSNGLWLRTEEGCPSNRSSPAEDNNNDDNYRNNKCKSSTGLSVAGVKMKKVKARRKVREPRFCFKTMSDVDVLDDGYKWRKYGQKVVKNTQHPRSYYRCTQDNCRVKKRVERLAEDPRMVITTYEGRHAHSPSHEGEEGHASAQMSFFW